MSESREGRFWRADSRAARRDRWRSNSRARCCRRLKVMEARTLENNPTVRRGPMFRRGRDNEAHPSALLAILCAATFMSSLDVFIVNVGLRSIGKDLGSASLADLSWILTAYAIVFAALLVPAGRLADRYGVKQAFLFGLAVFTLGRLGCARSGGVGADEPRVDTERDSGRTPEALHPDLGCERFPGRSCWASARWTACPGVVAVDLRPEHPHRYRRAGGSRHFGAEYQAFRRNTSP